jgi:hypothetical protein
MRNCVSGSTIVFAAIAMLLLLAPTIGEAQDIPRLSDGRPDFNGIWDKPRVASVVTDSTTCGAASTGCVQEGAGELRYTELGQERWDGYRNDWTGYCLPWGYTRAWQTSYPVEIMQTPNRMAILYESNNIFHMIHMNEDIPEDLETTWLGTSFSRWDGETLVIETAGFNGKTYIDTAEHPMSPDMRITERMEYIDADHLSYQVTWNDPVMYTEPFSNNRIFVRMGPEAELYEYWCMENNKDLLEGRLPPLIEQ